MTIQISLDLVGPGWIVRHAGGAASQGDYIVGGAVLNAEPGPGLENECMNMNCSWIV